MTPTEREKRLAEISMQAHTCFSFIYECTHCWLISELKKAWEREKVMKDALEEYGGHHSECIAFHFRMGEPTADGYRTLYGYGKKEKWFYGDEKPKCECGFHEALEKSEEAVK